MKQLAPVLLLVACGTAPIDALTPPAPVAPTNEVPTETKPEPCPDTCLTFDPAPLADSTALLDTCTPVEDFVFDEPGDIRVLDLQLIERIGERARIEVTFGNVDERTYSNYPGLELRADEGPVSTGNDPATWPLFAMFGCQVETHVFDVELTEASGVARFTASAGYDFFEATDTVPFVLEWK